MEELQQKLVDLQNQVDILGQLLHKNQYSNTEISTNQVVVQQGLYRSDNFVSGLSGWQFDALGNLEANNGNFRGDITGASGTFTGSITATTGSIGGFAIGADFIKDAADSFGLASTVSGGDDVRFWAGSAFAARASAPFRVYESGTVVASAIQITGSSTITAPAGVAVIALNLANRGWTQTCAFSVTDADTIAWGAGSFITADGGTILAISSGNTGNMAAKTYIYLDSNVSLTAYQVTTTPSTAVGAGKVLIAIAQNNTTEATYFVLGGQGGQNIDAQSIVAGSITANELSTSILYAGSIQIDTGGNIRSGQTAFDSGTGFFLGNSLGTPVFSIGIGGSVANNMTWDGTNLTVNGSRLNSEDIYGDGSDGDVTISTNTTLARDTYYNNLTINSGFTLNPGGFRIFVKNLLTRVGTGRIARDGNTGTAGTAATGNNNTGANGTGGAGGGALASGTLFGGNAGVTGKDGRRDSSNAPVTSIAGANGASISAGLGSAGVNGSQGGSGGNTSGGTAGTAGTAGSAGSFTAATYMPRVASLLVISHQFNDTSIQFFKVNGANGGSSGGGASGNSSGSSEFGGPGGGAGGGGSDGGYAIVAARILSLANSNPIISCKGGGGGNGGAGSSGGTANGGGGGGGAGGPAGNGGFAGLMYSLLSTGSVAFDVTAGAAGSAGALGTKNGTGTNGSAGSAGNAGIAGTSITLIR